MIKSSLFSVPNESPGLLLEALNNLNNLGLVVLVVPARMDYATGTLAFDRVTLFPFA
jgi:hypothetical protein